MMSKTVTREELYEALWQTPMNKLAAAWGVAIANIIRACKAMDVRANFPFAYMVSDRRR